MEVITPLLRTVPIGSVYLAFVVLLAWRVLVGCSLGEGDGVS